VIESFLTENLVTRGETAIDVVSYAAQIACQLGAHIVKVKLPTSYIEKLENKKVYQEQKIPIAKLSDRVAHIVQSAFNGKRIVIFSGGPRSTDAKLYEEAKAIREGGGFGSIIGRNAFQRSEKEAVKILGDIVKIYKG